MPRQRPIQLPCSLPGQRLAVAALAVASVLLPARAATAATFLPDTGLFAPVAAQQAGRLERIAKLPPGAITPERVELLLATGRVDEAADLLAALRGDPRRVALARARVRLTRHEFEAARPLAEKIASRRDASDAERALRFAWLFVRDDAAGVDGLTRGIDLAAGTEARLPDLIAAGRLAHDLMDFDRADSCFTRALERADATGADLDAEARAAARAEARVGLGRVAYKRRDYDGSLAHLVAAVSERATPDGLRWLAETLVRLGRTDEAIAASEWTVHLNPYHESGHYYLGNGYARRNYSQLAAAYPGAFTDAAGAATLARADSLLAHGGRVEARAAYAAVVASQPGWADARVRLASLDFEDGRFDVARDQCFEALRLCPEYGRAHATLAKALESQRFAVDVHRPGYEKRFAEKPMPRVPGIEAFVVNWRSLSPRHQKRIALSIAPWKQFIPVLVAGGSSYYIKPLHQKLSETPGLETLRDQRINYDSRLWDDVRGAGGYHTVTGVEDVERTIFDRYDTVLHELTHQVHAVLTADQSREITELYRQAKERDEATKNGFLSRYAGGSVWEYFAEGANALHSPRRDAWDPREEVRERLDAMDPDLRAIVERFMAMTDVEASYPVAFVNAGDDRVERGDVAQAVPWFEKALARAPAEETALRSLTRALTLANDAPRAVEAAGRSVATHPASGPVRVMAAEAMWHGGRGIDTAIALLEEGRAAVRQEDRLDVHLALSRLWWVKGDAARALAASDSALAIQSDHPEGLWSRASALALAGRWDEAFTVYAGAVRLRTGVVGLRCDYARDLLRAGRTAEARAQLDEARLLDERHPVAEALRGWADLAEGRAADARARAARALEWGPWCDLARVVLALAAKAGGDADGAREAAAPVRDRIAREAPPEYVYRTELSTWESVHELPAVERQLLATLD